ncbi:MAG: MBL fold metallo-hydrolase [Vulcanisaeta sp.]
MIDIYEINNGIAYQLRIPMNIEPGHVFSYIVRRDNDCIMIDAGYPNNELIKPITETIGKIPNCRLSALVVTHMHIDHYGLANELSNHLKVSVAIHKRDYEQLMRINDTSRFIQESLDYFRYYGVPNQELPILRSIIEWIIKRVRLSFMNPDIIIDKEDQLFDGLRIVLTPGHSPGHIAIILDQYRIAFTGDLILPTITTHVGLTPINSGNPLMEYMKSLIKIKMMNLKCLYPGHEGYVCRINERITELLNHRFARICEVLSVLKNEPMSIFGVTGKLKWMDNRNYSSLDPMNKYLALSETAAIMKYLESLGVIKRDEGKYYMIRDINCEPKLLLPQEYENK